MASDFEMYKAYVKELGRYDPGLLDMDNDEIKETVYAYKSEILTDWINITDEEKTVGFLIVSQDIDERHPDATYEICQLYVDQEHRRKGLASKAVAEYLSNKNGSLVSLDIINGNYTASMFWHKAMKEAGATYTELKEDRDYEWVDNLTLYGYRIGEKSGK